MSRCKAFEIPRNEAYAKGIRLKAQGLRHKGIIAVYNFPYALRPGPCALFIRHNDEG